MKQITLLLLFLFLGVGLMAQQGKVSGVITDQVTGKAIPEAIVRVGEQQAASDQNGAYEITGIKYGEYTLTVIAVGFENFESTVTISATPAKIKAELTSKTAAENERSEYRRSTNSDADHEYSRRGDFFPGSKKSRT